jgi:ribosome-associated protein
MEDYQKISALEKIGILREVKFKASLSGGKGGQNVNKVSTKIELYWKPADSKILNEEIKNKILSKIGSKLNKEGELRIVCEENRSQLKNKQKAIEKFYKLLTNCFKEKKKRRSTKPTKSSVKKRLEGKSKQKNLKAGRKKPEF